MAQYSTFVSTNRPVTESCTAGNPCLLFVTVVSFVTQLVCSCPEDSLVIQGIAELPELLNYSCAFSTQLKGKHSTLMGRHSIKLLCNVAFHPLLTQKQITSTRLPTVLLSQRALLGFKSFLREVNILLEPKIKSDQII